MLHLTFIVLFLHYIVPSKKGGLHLNLLETITHLPIQKKVISAILRWKQSLTSLSFFGLGGFFVCW